MATTAARQMRAGWRLANCCIMVSTTRKILIQMTSTPNIEMNIIEALKHMNITLVG